MSSALAGLEEREAVKHLSCFGLGLMRLHRALMKAATIVVVRSCVGVAIAADRS